MIKIIIYPIEILLFYIFFFIALFLIHSHYGNRRKLPDIFVLLTNIVRSILSKHVDGIIGSRFVGVDAWSTLVGSLSQRATNHYRIINLRVTHLINSPISLYFLGVLCTWKFFELPFIKIERIMECRWRQSHLR